MRNPRDYTFTIRLAKVSDYEELSAIVAALNLLGYEDVLVHAHPTDVKHLLTALRTLDERAKEQE